MCGIAGKLNFDNEKKVEAFEIESMCRLLIHRGPDDSGMLLDGNFGFGMRRLSIIDVDGGRQPLFNEDKTVAVILNGEIYNFRELRNSLLNAGHNFRTKTDTEVIVHLYEEFGEKFVEKLNGMFALAIYDKKSKKLILARDRLGIKPLYYTKNEKVLIFASELKALIEDKSVNRDIDFNAVDLYFSLMYIPAPFTIYKDVKKLSPGYMLICQGNSTREIKYWDITFAAKSSKRKEENYREEFLYLLEDSVKKMMVSDVPLGAFLSGGIDSSSIVAMMRRSGDQVKTFTVGFKGEGYHDESRYAGQIADQFSTDHRLYNVDGNSLLDWLDEYIYYFDEPFADYAAFPTHAIAEKARDKVKVVLTGDGCDELFAGYERYVSELMAKIYSKVPSALRGKALLPLFNFGKRMSVKSERINDFFSGAVKKSLLMELDEDTRYTESLFHFSRDQRRMLFSGVKTFDEQFSGNVMKSYLEDKKEWEFLSRRLYLDVKTSLPEQMLTKIDRTTMAVSLEARVPFLDHRLVEFAFKVPSSMKADLFTTKKFVRRCVKNILPEQIVSRPKHGFSSPMDKWIRYELKDKVTHMLSKKNIEEAGFLNYDYIRAMITAHQSYEANFGKQIFMCLIYVLWNRKFI
ncbi:MAG: asparagine synthase (glutamine-hydrolyzing) [Candidatus Omnitrophica bacterium]|nr:asparagine synthase (glutamine-hydrolyzing) [Candidatus Omnitrophota bacterium]